MLVAEVKVKSLSRAQLFGTPWIVAYQVPLSLGFSRQEYWSGMPLPSPGNLSDPGIEAGSPALQADYLPSELLGGLRSKSCSQPALVNKVLLEHSYAHSFAYL